MTCPTCGSSPPTPTSTPTVCRACGTPLTPNAHHLPRGHTLHHKRYTVGRVLGEGGFGITYLGADTDMQRPVAIKELFPDGATRQGAQVVPPRSLGAPGFAEAKTRFLQEAETLRRLSHPGIVTVYDVFEAQGTAYLVMAYLPGETLGERLRRGPLPPESVRDIAVQSAEALSAVHVAGLLHRDIKPENIFLTTDSLSTTTQSVTDLTAEDVNVEDARLRVVLIDFGSARAFAHNQTTAHTKLVTPGYAPPEQYASSARFSAATDLYALGATLHQALSGQGLPSAMERLLGHDLPALPDTVPDDLRGAITASLQVRIDDRPQSVTDFLGLLGIVHRPPTAKVEAERRTLRAPPPLPPRPERIGTHQSAVTALALHPNGYLLASGAHDRSIRLWDLRDGYESMLGALTSHHDTVSSVAFSPDGQTLLSGSHDATLKLWSVHGGRLRKSLVAAHAAAVTAVAFRGDGGVFASTGEDGRVRLWESSSYRRRATLSGDPTTPFSPQALSFHPDGRWLVVGGTGAPSRHLVLWDVVRRQTRPLTTDDSSVAAAVFSPDGRSLALGKRDGKIALWRLPDFEAPPLSVRAHRGTVRALAFSPDGGTLASSGDDGAVRVWDVAQGVGQGASQGRLRHEIAAHRGSVYALVCAAGGIVSAGRDGRVLWWPL